MGDSLLLWTNPGADKVSAVSNIHWAQDISVTLWRSPTSIQEPLTQWGDGWQDGEESPQVSQVLIFAQHFSTMNIFKGRETSCWNICKNGPQTGWVKKAFGVQCSSNTSRYSLKFKEISEHWFKLLDIYKKKTDIFLGRSSLGNIKGCRSSQLKMWGEIQMIQNHHWVWDPST